jgi:hypothetical protein
VFFEKSPARSKVPESIGTGNFMEITAYIRKLIECFPSFPAFFITCSFELLGITEIES